MKIQKNVSLEPAIVGMDPTLKPYLSDIVNRQKRYHESLLRIAGKARDLSAVSNGFLFYGLRRTQTGWLYREWAPAADALHLIGDFNCWNRFSHPMTPDGAGNWSVELPGHNALTHLSKYKVCVTKNGKREDRIPLYADYVVQDPNDYSFSAVVWAPESDFTWTDHAFESSSNVPPLIYEAHVGIAPEEGRVGTYREFADEMLPRIKEDGYNTIQLMAVMEHPYYGSFGYQVSNFYAPSSRFGTPDDLKYLINKAHNMGISVLLDLVHAHAVKNTAEGINGFDGTTEQFFPAGSAGDHPTWGTKVFNYAKDDVLHFLLSNLKYWLDVFHFDGFRFDGVTSMLYLNHGQGSFNGYPDHFSLNTNTAAVTYLQLACKLVHTVKPSALCIAEDVSGMPGLCIPAEDGGIGFDYRLAMGLPDYFINAVKKNGLGHWEMQKLFTELVYHRPNEKRIGYVECHDQAIVGDKTLIFRLADADMYYSMDVHSKSIAVDNAIAFSKLTRLIVLTVGGDGYLNFMGNEFGHPEWIDFPTAANNNSYSHARRQWSLASDPNLRYRFLADFDKAMLGLVKQHHILEIPANDLLRIHESDQILAYQRGDYVFAFNFHPTNSQTGLFIPPRVLGEYRVIFSTDDRSYGGFGNIDSSTVYHTWDRDPALGDGFSIYLPAGTAVILQRTDPNSSEKAK